VNPAATSQPQRFFWGIAGIAHEKMVSPKLLDYSSHAMNLKHFTSLNAAQERRLFAIIGLAVLCLLTMFNATFPPPIGSIRRKDYYLASSESLGFFNNVPAKDWILMKQRVAERQNHNDKILGQRSKVVWLEVPNAWYQNNWEPDFSCAHERRVGGLGPGPKWVCDPHRITGASAGRGCLVYSFGSRGNMVFEEALQKQFGNGTCEIHLFNPDFVPEAQAPMVHHTWGLESAKERSNKRNFMSFQETVNTLGHKGRTIDVLKIECEGCEWETYEDWFKAPVEIVQILVKVHDSPPVANDFFERMQANHYVTFHKEADTHVSAGKSQDFSFLHLAPSFFT